MGFLNFFSCVSTSDKVADCCNETTSVNKLPWEDIKKRTRNFSTVIGSGGFSTVYLARLPDSGLAAVKIQSACTDRLARMHDQELQILLRLKHPNIVRLLAHCNDAAESEQRVLLFEYASNGTLHDNLNLHVNKVPLTWKARTLIAFQLAEALEYLHGLHIIHGDIKASNILLDQHLNCKLCDFGSAKLGFTSMVLPPPSTKKNRMIMGSQGYIDPHYMKTGLVSKKNDVYSYGVVLLQLITGKEAFRFEKGERLTEIMVPVMRGLAQVEDVVDPRLRYGGGLELDEVKAMVSLAEMCIGCSPVVRPSATEIVAFINTKFQTITCI